MNLKPHKADKQPLCLMRNKKKSTNDNQKVNLKHMEKIK